MFNPATPVGAGAAGSELQPSPSGGIASTANTSASTSNITSGAANMSITHDNNSTSLPQASLGMASAVPRIVPGQPIPPLTTAPAGTAPRKQLAAAAAAGAAASAGRSGRGGKAAHGKKAGGGVGRRGGRGGGGRGGGRAGGGSGNGSRGGDDEDDGVGTGGKDSDDDNEDEPEVSIEEQFILRLPPGDMCDRFRAKVISREVDEDVKLKFEDARRGTFTFEGMEFSTKLVDLPTIIEAQKTLNGKQMYKIADISQMLIVDSTMIDKTNEVKAKVEDSDLLSVSGATSAAGTGAKEGMPAPSTPSPLKLSEYIWPDGLTNPMKNVRKRRFRKRVSKVAVEGVENEVERLLKEDSIAEEVVYEIREQIDGMDRFDSDDGATPAPEGANSDMDMDGEMMDMDEDDEEDDDDDLLAEIEREIGGGENSSDEEEDGDDGGGTPQPQRLHDKPSAHPSVNVGSGSSNTMVQKNAEAMKSSVGGTKIESTTPAVSFAGSGNTAKNNTKGSNKDKGSRQGGDDEDEDDGEDEDDEEEEDEEEEDDDDDSGSEDDDEDEDEDDKESAQMEKLLKDEIKELNGRVKDHEEKLQSAPNDILKRRFGSILDNLRKELELKTMQLNESRERSKSTAKS